MVATIKKREALRPPRSLTPRDDDRSVAFFNSARGRRILARLKGRPDGAKPNKVSVTCAEDAERDGACYFGVESVWSLTA